MSNKVKGLYQRPDSPYWQIRKTYLGVPIRGSTGLRERADAEAWLEHKCRQIRESQVFGIRPRHTFEDALTRHLLQKAHLKSIKTLAYHTEILGDYLGHLELDDIYDETLDEFRQARLEIVKPSTLKKHLEVVRAILRLAASSWRDPISKKTWLEYPPKITMPDAKLLARTSDVPYPLSHDELIGLLNNLGKHSKQQELMVRFCYHTGLRESELRNLRWEFEETYGSLKRPVFFVPLDDHKNSKDRIVVLSKRAHDILEHQRGINDTWVFANPQTGVPFVQLNTNQWQKAWRETGLPTKGFVSGPHNLRNTLGHRLRATGAPDYIIAQFLGHTTKNITQQYSSADIKVMMKFADKAEKVMESPIFRHRRVKRGPE